MSKDQKQSNTPIGGERLSRRQFTKIAAAYAATMAAIGDRALAQGAPVEYIIIGSGPGGGPLRPVHPSLSEIAGAGAIRSKPLEFRRACMRREYGRSTMPVHFVLGSWVCTIAPVARGEGWVP